MHDQRSRLSRHSVLILLGLMILSATLWASDEDESSLSSERFEEFQKEFSEFRNEFEAYREGRSGNVSSGTSRPSRFTFGGYGELHANFTEGHSDNQFDIHRLVFYAGYEFADWIRFHSETEIEHAYVSDDSGGELSLEQAHVDFLLSDALNVRFGRVLTPVGIVNRKHEPPSFNGVERPFFSKYIIPTTWSTDGIGVFGNMTPSLKYEAYIGGGLDGSGFDSQDGIRGGRNKERPGLNEPAVTGRVDFFPLAESDADPGQMLRIGLSAYAGGLDNGNKGSDTGIDGDIRIVSSDFEYTVGPVDFRGVVAHEKINGERAIGSGTADEIFGWYLESGVHVMPESWKVGKLRTSDAVVFLRYDDFDTQHRMPSGVARDPAGDRNAWTFGVTFHLTPSFVAKADVQIRDDGSGDDDDNLFNIGVGWQF